MAVEGATVLWFWIYVKIYVIISANAASHNIKIGSLIFLELLKCFLLLRPTPYNLRNMQYSVSPMLTRMFHKQAVDFVLKG
jgi:hypothetical protein